MLLDGLRLVECSLLEVVMTYNLDYIIGACGIAVGIKGIATSMYTKIHYPEGADLTDVAKEYIADYGLHQWVNGFIYGLSLTLMVGSFTLGLSRKSAAVAA